MILALESATEVCSVALFEESGELIDYKESTEGQKHSQYMTLFISEICQKSGIGLEEIKAVAVSEGPGSYTGLRVGYSCAKGIAYYNDIPMLAVSSLDAMNRKARDLYSGSDHIFVSMIDARRMEVYWKISDYQNNVLRETEAHILTDDSFDLFEIEKRIVFSGNAQFKLDKLNIEEESYNRFVFTDINCSARWLGPIASELYKNGDFLDIAYSTPYYLKSPNITKSKKDILQ